MKNFSGTLIFAVIVAAVGIYAYVVEYKGAEKKETAKQEAAKLVPFKSEDVNSLLMNSGDLTVELVKSAAGDWELKVPVQDLADSSVVGSFLGQVLEQKSEDVVEEGDKIDWTIFGLDKPKGQITVKSKDGKSSMVTVGVNEAMGGRRYVRLGEEKKVYLASALWDGFVTKTPKELRDHRVLRKSKDGVKSLKLVSSKGTIELDKTDKGWEAKSDKKLALDTVTIEGFLDTVTQIKATDFAAEAKSDKSVATKFRLSEKGAELTLVWNDDSNWSAKVNPPKDGKAYLTTSGGETVYELAAADVERWSKSLEDFRDKKKPFEFKREEVQEIELKTGMIQLGLKKDQSSWAMKTPDPNKDVDQEKVSSLFEKLEAFKADKFLGKSASVKPTKGEVVFRDQAGQVLFELKWGDNAKDPKISLVKTNKSDEVVGVNADLLSGLPSQTLLKDKATPSPVASPQPSAPAQTTEKTGA